MKRSTILGAALLACALGALPLVGFTESSAMHGSWSGDSGASASVSKSPTKFLGTLLDGAGRPVDDLVVQAFKDGSQTPTATALTYDSKRYGRDHGEFDLHVQEGSFRLLVTGRDSEGNELFKPLWIGGPNKIWAINSRDKKRLKALQLTPLGTFPTRTSIDFDGKNNVRLGQAVNVDVRVLCEEVKPLTGRVRYLLDGQLIRRGNLDRRGRDSLAIIAKSASVYTIQVEYEGGPHAEPSQSRLLRFAVSKK